MGSETRTSPEPGGRVATGGAVGIGRHAMRLRALRALAVLTVTLAGLGAGCGGSDDDGETPPSADSGAEEVSGDTEESTAEEAEPAPTELASAESSIDGIPARLTITSLVRSGEVVELTFELENLSQGAADTTQDIQISDTFEDPATPEVYDLSGISLIDGENGKRHLVAHDTEGACLCDGGLSGRFVDPMQATTLSASFAAPPEDVDVIDVFIPSFGTFHDVPMS